MKKLSQKIKEHLINNGYANKEFKNAINGTVDIALAIAVYAHKDQRRENEKPYYVHPFSCMTLYRNFVGILENQHDCIDLDLMDCCDIPFHGVQEVALLHDVLEDTDITINEIEEVFEIMESVLEDILYIRLGRHNLIVNKHIKDRLVALADKYSADCVDLIVKKLYEIRKQIDFNCSRNGLIDNLLLYILEVKYLCK